MRIKSLSKKKDSWDFKLVSEDHTLANLIKELSWRHKGEAAYKVEHSLLGEPIIRVSASNPKTVLKAVAKDIVKISSDVEKAFSK
jgi:DNA-directed RNA polymerase subunit L